MFTTVFTTSFTTVFSTGWWLFEFRLDDAHKVLEEGFSSTVC
jgi:hypothetical protein